MTTTDTQPAEPIRAKGYGAGEFDIGGLAPGEIDDMQAMLLGAQWVRVVDGRLETHPSHKPLPSPVDDPMLKEFWDDEALKGDGWHSPSIIVSSLGAGGRKYNDAAKQMTGWGFQCLRSKRDRSGRYWELWYLPFLGAAKGKLADAIKAKDWPQNATAAITFLCRHAKFGSADVMVQRAALTYD